MLFANDWTASNPRKKEKHLCLLFICCYPVCSRACCSPQHFPVGVSRCLWPVLSAFPQVPSLEFMKCLWYTAWALQPSKEHPQLLLSWSRFPVTEMTPSLPWWGNVFRHAPPGSHHPSVHPPSETTAICSLGYFNFRNVDFGFFFFKHCSFPWVVPE